jgi:hypothetical protein
MPPRPSATPPREDLEHAVSRSFPAGSLVLTLQAPKDETLQLERWYTRRFPARRAQPKDGARRVEDELVKELEDARQSAGAAALIVTARALTWLGRRRKLRRHLGRYPNVWAGEGGLLFSLRAPPGPQLQSFLDSVLPTDCTVAVATSGVATLLELDRREAWPFPRGPGGVYAPAGDSLVALEEIRGEGARFLVLPSFTPSWLDHHPGFVSELERRSLRVVRRENLCEVFDLTRKPRPRPGPRSRRIARGRGPLG